jgi:2,3-bisphosphoglycerate-dependent phosphoglycerate mutase
MDIVLTHLGLNCKVKESKYLIERHYGALTGLNKDEVKSNYGDKLFVTYRRSWDVKPPPVENNDNINTSIFENVYSESLKDVYNRVVPYFKENIEPLIKNNNVLIISHGNTLRALYKYLNNISDNDIEKFEIKNNELIFIN